MPLALPRRLRGGLALVAAIVLATATTHALGAPVKTEHVEAELVSAQSALVPGQPATLALRLKIEDGWHTYWKNPGDSGLPTTLAWKLPPGFTAGDIAWPAPRALPVGPLVNHGFEGEVLHLVTITPPADAKAGSEATLSTRADWLVCKETCIPDGADLALTLPVAATAATDGAWGRRIEAARAALPRALDGWKAAARGDRDRIVLTLVPPPGAADPGALHFFADAEARIEPSGAQPLARGDDGAYALTLPVSSALAGDFKQLTGVVTADRRRRWHGQGGDDRCAARGRRRRGSEAEARRRSDTRRQRPRGTVGERHHARGRARPRVPGRHDPEPDALRVSGAVPQGACAGAVVGRGAQSPA
jgi:thiol:disulfide interchange protein DsbD